MPFKVVPSSLVTLARATGGKLPFSLLLTYGVRLSSPTAEPDEGRTDCWSKARPKTRLIRLNPSPWRSTLLDEATPLPTLLDDHVGKSSKRVRPSYLCLSYGCVQLRFLTGWRLSKSPSLFFSSTFLSLLFPFLSFLLEAMFLLSCLLQN